jgi:alginate O-acetyltransferase complex protein AlgI
VMATWVLFRADTLGDAVSYLRTMVGLGVEVTAAPPIHRFLGSDVVIAIVAGVVASGPLGARWAAQVERYLRVGWVRVGQLAGVAVLLALVTLSLAGGAYNPFIYFRF